MSGKDGCSPAVEADNSEPARVELSAAPNSEEPVGVLGVPLYQLAIGLGSGPDLVVSKIDADSPVHSNAQALNPQPPERKVRRGNERTSVKHGAGPKKETKAVPRGARNRESVRRLQATGRGRDDVGGENAVRSDPTKRGPLCLAVESQAIPLR